MSDFMKDIIGTPLTVFGLGFAISMSMAVIMKLLMDVIKFLSKESKDSQE